MQRAECRQQLSPGGTGLRPGLEPGPVRTGPAHGTVQVPSENLVTRINTHDILYIKTCVCHTT